MGALLALKYQASTLTQNGAGPVGPVTPRIYWSCKIFTGPTNLSLTFKKTLLKIDRHHLFLFIFSSFISNKFWIFLRGNLLIKCPQMFTGPGNFYWPGAIGSLLALSPEYGYQNKRLNMSSDHWP